MRMLRSLLLGSALALAPLLSACSTSQLQGFQSGLTNFTAGVASVNQTIATVSPTLAAHCGDAQLVGAQLAAFVNSSSSAGAGLAAINAAINTWCQAPPNDIKSAIASIAAQVAAGRAAYQAVKRGN